MLKNILFYQTGYFLVYRKKGFSCLVFAPDLLLLSAELEPTLQVTAVGGKVTGRRLLLQANEITGKFLVLFILNQRYVSGEIYEEEYVEKKKILKVLISYNLA